MHARCTREVHGSALLHGLGVAHVGLYLGDVLDLVRVRVRARVGVRVRVGARVRVRVRVRLRMASRSASMASTNSGAPSSPPCARSRNLRERRSRPRTAFRRVSGSLTSSGWCS